MIFITFFQIFCYMKNRASFYSQNLKWKRNNITIYPLLLLGISPFIGNTKFFFLLITYACDRISGNNSEVTFYISYMFLNLHKDMLVLAYAYACLCLLFVQLHLIGSQAITG